MKLIGIIIKSTLAGVAAYYLYTEYSNKDSIWEAVLCFALMYGLITYYIWFFQESGFSFVAYLGENGLIMTVISLCFKIFTPLIVIMLPIPILDSFLSYETAMGIWGSVILIAVIVCIIRDIVAIVCMFIRLFKPRHYEDEED